MSQGTKLQNTEAPSYPASEMVYQTLFEHAADGIFLADEQGRYIHVNPRGCEMLGYAREELLGLSLEDLIPAEDVIRNPPQPDELRAGKTSLMEHRLRCGDGSLLSVEISARMLADGRLVSIVRDTSEHQQAEELLRKQAHNLRTLMDLSPDIIARFDRQGRYLYVNSTVQSLVGIPVEELLGRRIGERLAARLEPVVPEEFLGLRQAVDDVFTTGGAFETETRISFPDCERIFNVRLIPETDLSGEVVSVLLFSRDVTEQKQVEKALRASEERLQLAMDAAQMGQWDWNIVMDEVVCSPKCLAIYGLSPGTPMSYERFQQAVHPDDRERIDAALKRAVDECSCYDDLNRTVRPDGAVRWTASRGQVYCNTEGQAVRMIGVTIDVTEWKEAEEKLRHTAKELQRVLDSINGIVWEGNAKTFRFSFVSKQAEILLGYPVNRWLTEPDFWKDHIHPDDREWAVNFCAKATKEKRSHEFEYRMLTADGRVIWLHDLVNVVVENDQPVRFRGIMVDISERKQAEKERQAYLRFLESMDRVNRAMQGTNDLEQMMNDVLDVVLTIFHCDRAWLTYPCDSQAPSWQMLMEQTRPEYPGALALGIKVPMKPDVVRVFKTVIEASGPVKFGPGAEHPLPAEVAGQFSIQSQMAMAIYPKTGKPWLFGLHQCATPRVWTQEEERLFREIGHRVADALTSLLVYRNLRESEHRLEEAQRIAHVGWWDRDYDDDCIALSDEACRIFGVPLEETQRYDLEHWHKRWKELIHPQDRPKAVSAAKEALQGGPRYDVEYRVVRPGGEMRVIYSRADVIWDASGRPRRMFGIMQDITELRRTEDELRHTAEELQRHREHLEELVTTRTAELAEAKTQAEEADRLKSAFLATMSHELRTPLNSIIGFTGIMLQGMTGPLNDEQQLQLGMVKHSARHLLDLINDILDLSKIEAGQVELQVEPFDITAVIDKTVQALMPLAEKKQLALVSDIAEEPIELVSDAHRVEQILINLVNNAIKFTERGRVCIACRVSDGSLRTSVTDTGIGIRPEDVKNLFTTFRQLDSTLGRKHEGTGLGLSICRKLAGLLGGEIQVESTWGEGSRFTLMLPLNVSSQEKRQR